MTHCSPSRLHFSNVLNSKSISTKVISAVVASSSIVGLSGIPVLAQTSPARQVAPASTTFHCVRVDNMFATIAKRADRATPPMITWQDTSFGSQYTPERRCQIVSDRLTQAVAQNGGRLVNLRLTYGPLNGFPVICYVRSREESCGSDNLLLTLRQDDRGKEMQILQQILTFSIQGQGAPLTRGPSNVPEPIAFGSEVERALNSHSVTPGVLPRSLGSFRQEAERSFGTGATPVTTPQPATSPRSNIANPDGSPI